MLQTQNTDVSNILSSSTKFMLAEEEEEKVNANKCMKNPTLNVPLKKSYVFENILQLEAKLMLCNYICKSLRICCLNLNKFIFT